MTSPNARGIRDASALFKAIDGKLAQDDIDALSGVFESIHEQAEVMFKELTRLKADNRKLRSLLAESRRVHRAASEDYRSESFLGRLFGL